MSAVRRALGRARAIAGRHRLRVWLLWAIGLAFLLCTPAVLIDPGILVLALDPEMVALLIVSGVALLRTTTAGLLPQALRERIRLPPGTRAAPERRR